MASIEETSPFARDALPRVITVQDRTLDVDSTELEIVQQTSGSGRGFLGSPIFFAASLSIAIGTIVMLAIDSTPPIPPARNDSGAKTPRAPEMPQAGTPPQSRAAATPPSHSSTQLDAPPRATQALASKRHAAARARVKRPRRPTAAAQRPEERTARRER